MLNLSERSFYWAIREKHTDDFMGIVSLNPHHDDGFLEVSYQFLPAWWEKGYARETDFNVFDFVFKSLHCGTSLIIC